MPTNRILIDTAPLVGLISPSDQYHHPSVSASSKLSGDLLTCWPVVTEAAWHLRGHRELLDSLLDVFASEDSLILPLNAVDILGIRRISAKYGDQGLQLADATLMHLAERDRIDSVFTFDRKDFSLFRKQDGSPLKLIPAVS